MGALCALIPSSVPQSSFHRRRGLARSDPQQQRPAGWRWDRTFLQQPRMSLNRPLDFLLLDTDVPLRDGGGGVL